MSEMADYKGFYGTSCLLHTSTTRQDSYDPVCCWLLISDVFFSGGLVLLRYRDQQVGAGYTSTRNVVHITEILRLG